MDELSDKLYLKYILNIIIQFQWLSDISLCTSVFPAAANSKSISPPPWVINHFLNQQVQMQQNHQ